MARVRGQEAVKTFKSQRPMIWVPAFAGMSGKKVGRSRCTMAQRLHQAVEESDEGEGEGKNFSEALLLKVQHG